MEPMNYPQISSFFHTYYPQLVDQRYSRLRTTKYVRPSNDLYHDNSSTPQSSHSQDGN